MLPRRELFPHVIEMNHQARRRLGCCVYLVGDTREWLLIDIGYADTTDEIVELIRQMDFPLANCKTLIATHADVDHIQGLARASASCSRMPRRSDIPNASNCSRRGTESEPTPK